MYKAERLSTIKQLLLENKSVGISELIKLLNVSAVTARAYLEELQNEGFAVRTHGGAVLNEEILIEEQSKGFFVGNHVPYEQEKEIIGEIASSFVENNEWIFLGSGTTTYYIARALIDRPNLNVLTNNLMVAYELTKNTGANVIMTGGTLSHNTYNLGGEIFSAYLRDMMISKAFMSVAGVDIERGYTVTTAGEFNVFQVIRKISTKMYIVADYNKFDKSKFIRVGDLESADALITDKALSGPYSEYFEKYGVRIITPDSLGR